MNDKNRFLITVRFPPWGYHNNDKYPAFGIRYLIEVPAGEENIRAFFQKIWKEKIGGGEDWDGEILFVEAVDYIVLN